VCLANALDLFLESLMQQQILRSHTVPQKRGKSLKTPLAMTDTAPSPAPSAKEQRPKRPKIRDITETAAPISSSA